MPIDAYLYKIYDSEVIAKDWLQSRESHYMQYRYKQEFLEKYRAEYLEATKQPNQAVEVVGVAIVVLSILGMAFL